jgi:hypothetical protein
LNAKSIGYLKKLLDPHHSCGVTSGWIETSDEEEAETVLFSLILEESLILGIILSFIMDRGVVISGRK